MTTFLKYSFLCLNCLFAMCSFGQSSGGNWFQIYGNSSTQCGGGVECTINSNLIICGNFYGTVDFDPGSGVQNLTAVGDGDAFFSKLDNAGNLIWVKQIGSVEPDWMHKIKTDPNENIYVTGGFEETVDFDPGPGVYTLTTTYLEEPFLGKYDADGEFLWVLNFGFEDDLSTIDDIELDSEGNVYVVGKYTDSADFDPGPGVLQLHVSSFLYEMYIVKLDSNGSLIWANSFPASGNSYGTSIEVDSNDDLLISGEFGGMIDFDLGSGTAIHNSQPIGTDDFILKLDSSGNYIWSHVLNNDGNNTDPVVAVDQDNSVFIAGQFQDTTDFDPGPGSQIIIPDEGDSYLLKLDSAGNFVWVRSFGGIGYDQVSDICVSIDGSINLVGNYSDSCNFDGETDYFDAIGTNDIFTIKFNSDGAFRWVETHSGDTHDWANGVASDGHGAVYTIGCFTGSSNFIGPTGPVNVSSSGSFDIFFQKYHESLNFERIEPSIIDLYPNPVQSELYLKADYSFNFEIYNLNGQMILSSSGAAQDHYVDVNFLDNGTYLVYFFSDVGFATTRFIKM